MMYNYETVEREGVDNWCIRITDGPYKDTVYYYEKVMIAPPEGKSWDDINDGVDMHPVLTYNYVIIESDSDPEDIQKDPELDESVGDILVHLVQDTFDKGDYKIGDKNASESGNDNPAEPNQ